MNVATTLLDAAGRHDTDEALVDGPVRLDYAAVVRYAGVVSAGLSLDLRSCWSSTAVALAAPVSTSPLPLSKRELRLPRFGRSAGRTSRLA